MCSSGLSQRLDLLRALVVDVQKHTLTTMRRWLELLGTTIQVQPGELKALVTVNLPIEGHLIDFSISQ
jgi:hypothetical protein